MDAVWNQPTTTADELTTPEVTPAKSRRRSRRIIVPAVVVVAVVAVATGVWKSRTAPAPVVAAAPVILNVHSLGYLEPKSKVIRLAAPSTTEQVRVERLLVAEGDAVRSGDVLAVLDNYERRSAAVAEAEARVEVEQAKLEQIKAGAKPGDLAAQQAMVSRARSVLNESLSDLKRSERLVSRNAAPAAELDDAKLKVESARDDLKHAESTLESLGEVRAVDVQQQEKQIAAATASLAMARAELAMTEVRAPIDGRILKICVRPGERISDDGILEIGDTSEMYAVAEVYEADLPRVRLGQPAAVKLFTGAGEKLAGEVAEIGMIVAKKDVLANDPVADTDARVVEVRVRLKPEDARTVERLSNARVEVTIDSQTSPSK
ncbi:HlyD family efflux transporter periplasmic adaptor subunit [Lacipirellula limnantheis]|uniref:Multidrug resistance protein MdtN n=1 Tax=Lacipirellula limnantheis TaxID=2528024 RepID=A0A517TW62_9BACT|nr:HlyD family efflux transporter periplasmic adaptor subunit [Lacipirellula limnantheis]QDT72606.1 Multidrug resistance protein MdtN [Lacipirellula limnantheis]